MQELLNALNNNKQRNLPRSSRKRQEYIGNTLVTSAAGEARPRAHTAADAALGNPVSVPGKMMAVYKTLGETDEGRQFALCNLHPCGEYITNAPGIPDETQQVGVTPTFRGDSVVAFNATLFDPPIAEPTGDFRYDVQVVVVPVPEIDYIYRLRYAGQWSRWVAIRTAYFSAEDNGQAVTLSSSGYSSARVVGRGVTIHLDAPDLANQGRLVAGQIKAVKEVRDMDYESDTNQNFSGVVATSYYVPMSETELTQQDPLAAQWEAKCGSYIPHRYLQPFQKYKGVANPDRVAYNSAGGTRGLPATVVGISNTPVSNFDTSATGTMMPFYNPTADWGGGLISANTFGASPNFCTWGCSPPLNHLTSVQFFLGISNQAQLHIKSRLHMECEVHARQSAVTPFAHKSPTLDRTAMDLVTKIAQNQQHVFYAWENDLSGILQSIGKVISTVVRPVGKALGSTGIPVLSEIGNAADQLGGALSNAF